VRREGLESDVAALALTAMLMALAAAPAAIPQALATPATPPPASLEEPPPLAEDDPLLRGSFEDVAPAGASRRRPGVPLPGATLPGAPWPPASPPPFPRPMPPLPRPFEPAVPLPALAPYKGSYVARQALRAPRLRPTGALPVTVAAPPGPAARPRRKHEENPYEPLGLRLGSTQFFPYLDTAFGHDDNPNRLPADYQPKPSVFFLGGGGVTAKSDWSRHSLEGELRGGYSTYFSNPDANRPEASGRLAGRFDISRDTALETRGGLSLSTMRPGAPGVAPLGGGAVAVATMTNRPAMLDIGTQIGPTQRLSRFEVSARGTYDRVWWQDAYFSDGTVSNLARSSYNDFGGLLRLAYEASPAFRPFIEATGDRRVHDEPTDLNGFYRDSTGYTLRGGAAVEVTALVKGEIAGGYGQRDYADPRLPKLRGPVIDATLIYTPSALTTVTLRGSTSMNETTVSYASGMLTQSIVATLSHDLLRNLNVILTADYFTNTYQGSNVRERGGGAGVQLEYKITRSVSLRGGFMRQTLDSTYSSADYTANVYTIGLRFQL
jgi:hypothetical protein